MDSLIIYILFVWCKLHMYIVKCYVNCVSYNIIVMMLKNKKAVICSSKMARFSLMVESCFTLYVIVFCVFRWNWISGDEIY